MVILHFPQGVSTIYNNGEYVFKCAINLQSETIKGSVGAGDNLAAGVLYGLHENWDIGKSLEVSVNVVVASLMEAISSGGIGTFQECMKFGKMYWYNDVNR